MNGNYYQNPTFPNNQSIPMNNQTYAQTQMEPQIMQQPQTTQAPTMELSYIENILRSNLGKNIKAFFSYPDSNEWRDKEYNGTIEEAGIDHIIIRDAVNGNWYLLRMIYLNYFEFIEPINYNKP